jgi:hypothetical protein
LPKRPLLLTFLLIASVLALSACGGGGSSDESQIEEAVESSATSSDPADCKKLGTQNFMEQGTDSEGAEAVKGCEKEATEPETKAESVAVSKVEVEGSKATAEAAVTGGGFDGQTVEIALVKEGEQWKLNEITGFAKLDQPKLVETFEKEFAKPTSGVSEKIATCVDEGLKEASQPEIEEYLLSGSSKPIEELAEECS